MEFLGAIAAMTKDRIIGVDGKLPWHYPEDLKRFKQRTIDCTVIMGRLTWESLNCRALPRRRNIVISRSTVDNVEHYASLEDALNTCQQDRTWIIGGGQIYTAAFDRLTLLDITYVPDIINDPKAVAFPEIKPEIWRANEPSHLEGSSLVNIIYKRRSLNHGTAGV